MAENEKTNEPLDSIIGIDRREAIRRVSVALGGVTFVGGSALLAACERERPAVIAGAPIGAFTADEIAFLDEIAETILPETKTPGAKAAQTGAFMALMVTDTYDPSKQKIFRDGMQKLDDASRTANNASFMSATPQQRLSLLETLDREQKTQADARDAAKRRSTTRPDTVQTAAATKPPGRDLGAAAAITEDEPTHYFRMMKELALLGYFTSEIGYMQAQRYVESPGRFDPCVPYQAGEKAWAGHA